MNVVDLAIIGVLGLAAVHGVTQGAAIQVLSFGGFWLGLLLGAAVAPFTQGLVDTPFAAAFVSLFTFLGLALIGGAVGRYFGTHAWGALQRLRLGKADAALGGIVAVTAALAAIWLVALLLSAGPTRQVAQAVHRSAIVRALVDHLPPAPSVFARLQQFVASTPFPRVFEGLEPIPAGPVQVPGSAAVQAAVSAAGNSTVRVVGLGCGGVQTGSGFVVGPGNLVVTNAHVVAGIDAPRVEDGAGTHRSVPVLFDPELDLAILRVGGLAGGPLPILAGDAGRGDGAAVLGYPGGGRFDAVPAAIIRRFFATGRDIYNQGTTRRDVYQLQARIRQGNSGGPFVRQDGTVLGVVFAASTTQADVGYALTSREILPRVQQARNSGPVDTGACAA